MYGTNCPADIILFDLDGTLADCTHRLHHITPAKCLHVEGEVEHPKKNWKAFFFACGGDKPILHNVQIFRALAAQGYQMWITSGRSDEVRAITEMWLVEHDIPYDRLIMRKEGDFTEDDVLKVSWLRDGTIPGEQVLCAFDDRSKVVRAWRHAGIPCMQVAAGDF